MNPAAFVLLFLLSAAAAVEFEHSVILTSADIPVDKPQALASLKSGSAYRIYATYASGSTEEYAKNVYIYDSVSSYSLAGLSKSKPGSDYILDDKRILRAPITIHDTNKGAAEKVPYTVYIVDDSVYGYPVASARLAGEQIFSPNSAPTMTILSAESYFTVSNFDFSAEAHITSVGYDDDNSAYVVMRLSQQSSSRSFLTVYGPIITIFTYEDFTVKFTRNTKFDQQLTQGASFSLMSPGYLSNSQSYNIAYKVTEALDRAYKFDTNVNIRVNYEVSGLKNQENAHLQVTSMDNAVTDVNVKQDGSSSLVQWANKVSLSVQNTDGDHVPRYLFQITSGSSFSFSLAGLFLVSLFAKLL